MFLNVSQSVKRSDLNGKPILALYESFFSLNKSLASNLSKSFKFFITLKYIN